MKFAFTTVTVVLAALVALEANAQGGIAQSCSLQAQGFCLEGPTWRGINCLAFAMYGCASTKRDSEYCTLTSRTLAPHIGADNATVEKLIADCRSGNNKTLTRILDSRERTVPRQPGQQRQRN